MSLEKVLNYIVLQGQVKALVFVANHCGPSECLSGVFAGIDHGANVYVELVDNHHHNHTWSRSLRAKT